MPAFCSEPGCYDVATKWIGVVPFCEACYMVNMEAPTEPEEEEHGATASG